MAARLQRGSKVVRYRWIVKRNTPFLGAVLAIVHRRVRSKTTRLQNQIDHRFVMSAGASL